MKEALGSSETLVLTRDIQRKIPEDTILLVTLMMEVLRSFETSVVTRATRRNNLEDDIHIELQLFLTLVCSFEPFGRI
jgi:hypothetical protein